MSERLSAFEAFEQELEEHARIERLGGRCIASIDGPARPSRQRDDARLLQEISTLLIQAGDVTALYEHILDSAIILMSSDMGSFQILDERENALRLIGWRGFHPQSAAFWDRIDLGAASTSCEEAFTSRRRIVVPDVEICDFMAGSADLDSYRLSNIRAVQSTPLVSRSGQMVGMISTHWREPHHPPEHALQLLDVLARQAADLIERTQREEELRFCASLIETSDDAIVALDFHNIITSWNKGAERIFGFTAEEAVGQPYTMLIPPDRRDEDASRIERLRRGERVEHYETVRQHKDGNKIDVAVTASAIRNAAGQVAGVSKISRDIGERKRAEAQILVLAREAEHRAKNVLATVQATVHLTQADTVESFKQVLEGRIQALANVHRLFVDTRWTGADIQALIIEELAAYSKGREAHVQLSGPNCLLEPSAAQAIAVTLHELATNAAKYGSLSVPNGRVQIEWSCEPGKPIVLRWTETDGPPVKPPKHRGFGTRVVKSIIRDQLKGEIRADWRKAGLVCEIVLPPQ